MKNFAVIICVVIVLVILGLVFTSFQVRETECALVMTFQKPPDTPITEPGWYFKWPPPIQWVYKFDSRLRVLDAKPIETTTSGDVPIIVNTYVIWRIADPLRFHNAVETVQKAESTLNDQLKDTQNRIVGQYSFGQFVNSDRSKIKFEEIQAAMLADLKKPVLKNYGISVETLGIKQLKIDKENTAKVFERMKSERNRRTEKTISQGNAEAAKIRKDADLKRTELLAAAEARAKAIRGQGDAEAAKYYKMLEEDPEFAMFLRDIEAVKNTLAENATIVIKADTEPFDLLRQMPLLAPKDAGDPNNPS
ncbi:MAG: protease modulator HflC [Sedimentisphaerales bacterium]|nr:protease modulator HflC [Sedimentisphaerales bacterium]